MTISSTTRKAGPFAGNGVATMFPFNFKVFNTTDVKLILVGTNGASTTLTLNSDYSVALNANQNSNPGGTITYPISGTPLPIGYQLVALGGLPNDQETDLTNSGGFYPQVIGDMVDRATIQIQQLAEKIARAIVVNESESPPAALPAATSRANMLFGFDSAGNITLYNITASVGAGNLTNEGPFVAGTNFTAGTTTALTLSKAYGTAANLDVHFVSASAVTYIGPDQYSLSGNQINFASPIPTGTTKVYIVGGTTLSVYVPAGGSVGDAQLAWGSVLHRVVDSVAAISTLDITKYSRVIATDYYQAGGYGGGGEFLYSATSAATVNNATVLAAAGGVGRWLLVQKYPVSLLQWGAKPDGTDQSTPINAAFAWAQASNLTLDISGNFSVTKVTLTGANGMALQGRGSLVGIATAATDCVFELINSSDITINGRLVINANYNTNYAYGAHAYTNAAGQTVAYLDFTNLPVVGAKVGYAFGSTTRPDDQVSEINLRGGYTYGCPVALQGTGVQTVVNVQGANLISSYGGGNAAWQTFVQKTVIAAGATVNITGGELLHPAISTGSLCEIQPLASVTQGINLFGTISVCNAVCEPACPLATTANPNGLASPQGGCIQFIGCNGVHTQNSFAFVQTDNTFAGRLIFSANYFHATVARTFANISCGANCDVYCDDYSFGPNFVQGLSGITGGIVHFSHRRILEASNTSNQSFANGVTTIAKYTSLLNNADTTGRFSNGYSTGTGQFTAPQGLKDVEVHGAGYFAALTTTPVTVDVYVNGAQKIRYCTTSNQWFGGGFVPIGDLNANDTVDMRFTQGSGAAQTEGGGAMSKFVIKARY